MRVLSASEAVAPAFKRTWEFYFKPLRMGRSWKWAASAYLGQFGLFFLPLPLPLIILVLSRSHHTPLVWVVTAIASAVFIAFGFWIFYLCTRLELVMFEAMLTKAPLVRPIWQKYRVQTWQMIGARLLLSSVLGVFIFMPMIRYFENLVNIFRHMPAHGAAPDPMAQAMVFHHLLSAELFFFGGMGVIMLLSSLLSDFMIPTLALERQTLQEATSRMLRLFRTEPITMLGYFLLKGLLALVGFIAQYIANLLIVLVSLIPFGIVGGIIGVLSWLVLHGAGIVGHVVLISELAVAYLLFIGWAMYLAIGELGILLTFLQYYALYFLGGRYPSLGNALEPPVYAAPPHAPEPPMMEPPLPEPLV